MVYGRLVGRLLPERCPGCRQESAAGFCRICRAELERIERACTTCGLPQPVGLCPRRYARWHVERVLAPLRYVQPLDHYVLALKFQRARRLGRALGLLLAEAVHAARAETAVDALVPVPLHRARLRERGYNQAVEIARALSAELAVPMIVRGVLRNRRTAPQSGAQAAARYANVRQAFTVRRELAGSRLAIVDDVITTGATMNALAGALRAAGAARVHGWAVARTQ